MNIATLLPGLLLLAAPLAARSAGAEALKRTGAAVETDPRYPQVVSYTLKNGFRLLILEKKFVPTVSFTTIFRTGNVDNIQGKTGLAHLFEHMAFKGTRTMNTSDYAKEKVVLDRIEAAAMELIAEEGKARPDGTRVKELRDRLTALEKEADKYIVREEFWKLYNELGENGLNAMTSADYTGYVVQLPANRLEAWMIMESDRFLNPVLREFYRERSVVMEERRMNESNPGRMTWEVLFASAFAAHPYRNPTIGWQDDLTKLTRTDAERFFADFYGPNNATLAIVGDVDAAEVIKLAKKYFEPIKPRPLPATDYTREPAQNAEKRTTVFFKAKPLLRIGYHNEGYSSDDIHALIMLSEVLSNGKTSRFYKGLVEGRQLALYAGSYHSTPGNRYPSLFVISAAPKAPATLEQLESAIYEEIERLQKDPPTAWELEKIINNYEADLVKQLESNSGLGMSLAYNQQILGDWKYDWNVGSELRKVTPEQIQAAARKYLVPSNRTVVLLREQGS